jgi:hypothetical protein
VARRYRRTYSHSEFDNFGGLLRRQSCGFCTWLRHIRHIQQIALYDQRHRTLLDIGKRQIKVVCRDRVVHGEIPHRLRCVPLVRPSEGGNFGVSSLAVLKIQVSRRLRRGLKKSALSSEGEGKIKRDSSLPELRSQVFVCTLF